MTTSLSVLGSLAALTAALGVPLGHLRAGAVRYSHRRCGLLAASVVLALALRHAFSLAWSDAWVIFLAMLVGQLIGSRCIKAPEPSPLRWRVAAYAVLLGALLLLAGSPAQAQTGKGWEHIDADEVAPEFTLTSQDGKRVALKDFRGKAVVLSFIFTECKDICPVLPQILGRTEQWLNEDEKRRVHFIGVSIDPRRDTPAKLTSFMQAHGLSAERWTLLTGSLPEVSKVVENYGVLVKPDLQGDLVHNAVYILIDPQGRLRTEFHGLFSPTQEIATLLRELIAPKIPPKQPGKKKG